MGKIKFTPKYGSHIPLMLRLLEIADNGPLLELGGGLMSTPIFHWICLDQNREFVTYENNKDYYNWIKPFELNNKNELHKIIFIEDWDKADIERYWEIAFIDHAPGERRAIDIKRLQNFVKYIVIHDSEWKADKHYHYKSIYHLFKYRYDYKKFKPFSTILSNFVDVTKLNFEK